MRFEYEKKVGLRKRVYFMLGQLEKKDVIKHFLDEKIPRSTIYSIIKRYEDGTPVEDKPRKGRPSKFNNKTLKKLKNDAKNKVGVSQKKLARKFKVTQQCIGYNLKKIGLKYFKRQRAPKYSEKQLSTISSKCRKLRRKFITAKKFVIIDDEKYFTFTGDNMPGNAGFYSENKEGAPVHVKYKCKQKYPQKILVWLALSSKGVSNPFIGTTKGFAISSDNYVKKCLPKLVSFINKYHGDGNYIFWPDLASSHYAKKTIEWLDQHSIKFVPKVANPPNVPKARPIEDFWSILADKVYEGGWEAETEKQLINRIKKKLNEVDLNLVQTMMQSITTKLRKIEDHGPFSIL